MANIKGMTAWATKPELYYVLRCTWCFGRGIVLAPGTLGSYEVVCKQCCGQGILPIPYCEMGLPEYWGEQ